MSFNMLADWRRAQEVVARSSRYNSTIRLWIKPPAGWIKINVDTACNQRAGTVGLGCVIRDEYGSFHRPRSKGIVHRMSPREA